MMSRSTRILAMLATFLTTPCFAQQAAQPQPTSRAITLNVVVSSHKGDRVEGLTSSDFTLLDNKTLRPIETLKPVTASAEQARAIIVIDAVNTAYTRVAFERGQVTKFLTANGGRLAQPTTIAVLTDKGAQIQKGFSTDGNALSAALAQTEIGLRTIRRSSGIWGANERVGISLTALHELIGYSGTLPGRKIVLWISPGWPLLTGPHIDLGNRQQQKVFDDVVTLTRDMQKSNMTLYNINPLGPEEDLARTDYYQAFLKGVKSPSKADIADLSLQVLAAQSGGLVVSSSDVAGSLKDDFADIGYWYELTFNAATAEHPNEFHSLDLRTDRPGLTVRTRTGYYAQP